MTINMNDKKLARMLAKIIKQTDVCLYGLPEGEIKLQMYTSRSANFQLIFKMGFNLSLDYKLITRKES